MYYTPNDIHQSSKLLGWRNEPLFGPLYVLQFSQSSSSYSLGKVFASRNKYPSIFSSQTEAIVYIFTAHLMEHACKLFATKVINNLMRLVLKLRFSYHISAFPAQFEMSERVLGVSEGLAPRAPDISDRNVNKTTKTIAREIDRNVIHLKTHKYIIYICTIT